MIHGIVFLLFCFSTIFDFIFAELEMDLNNLLIGNWELKVGFLEIFGCFKNFFMEFADDVSMIF